MRERTRTNVLPSGVKFSVMLFECLRIDDEEKYDARAMFFQTVQNLVPFVEIPSKRTLARPLDLYFHSGFHFLLFSVRRTRSFLSHVIKRTKGPPLSSTSHLDFHAAPRKREIREIRPFCNFQASRCATLFKRRIVRLQVYREFYRYISSSRSPDASNNQRETDDPCE